MRLVNAQRLFIANYYYPCSLSTTSGRTLSQRGALSTELLSDYD